MEPTIKPTGPRPVMDIRPQRPAPVMARSNFSATATAPAPVQPTVTPEPAPVLTHQDDGVQPTPEHFPANLPKHKTPFLAIFLAIVVGGSLIAVTIFGYNKSQNKAATTTDQNSATTQPVTADDVDATVDSTDEALKALDDTADFNASDLADDTLGL